MIHFVTDHYLKSKMPITSNVASNEIALFVEQAGLSFVQPILGRYFYNDLLVKYNAQTLSADETILVEKIQPAIGWRTTYDCVIALTYQLKNKGLQKQNGDNSESVEMAEVGFVGAHYVQKAELFENILRKYIKRNKALFPVYTSALNNDCEDSPVDGDTFNDILFI
jgi:hypothetical protein